jgi:hypothetical protein
MYDERENLGLVFAPKIISQQTITTETVIVSAAYPDQGPIVSKYIAVDNPLQVYESLARGDSSDWEDLDLTTYLGGYAGSLQGVALRVIFWDSNDASDYWVKFRSGGSTYTDGAHIIYTPARKDATRPQFLLLGTNTSDIVQFYVSASGAATANLRIFLTGYFVAVRAIGPGGTSSEADGLYVDGNRVVTGAADCGLILEGSATVFDDLMIPGHGVRTGASAPDWGNTPNFAGNANFYFYAFDGTNTLEQVYFTVQFPHTYKVGSKVFAHVHFVPLSTNTGDTNSRTVRFILEYSWASINGTFGAGGTIELTKSFVPNTSLWKHLIADNANGIEGTDKDISSMMICRLYRDPTNPGDTYPQDVAFLQFDIHHEIDQMGSSQEYIK